MLIYFLKMQQGGKENLRLWKDTLKAELFIFHLDRKVSVRHEFTGPQNKAVANSSVGARWELGLKPEALEAAD